MRECCVRQFSPIHSITQSLNHSSEIMAHKKGVGSSRNGRDSNPNYLGVKLFGGQHAKAGSIIVRQRGTKHNPGRNVGLGRDHTLFALVEGHVVFAKKAKGKSWVSIEPIAVEASEAQPTATAPVAAEA